MYLDLVDRLHEKLMEQPLCPKILIARSYADGHQLLEQICKRKGFIYNVEVQTLNGLVMDDAKLELYRKQVSLLDSGQTYWVVRSLMKQLANGAEPSYISEHMLTPGIVDRVHRAVQELRHSTISSDSMVTEGFTNLAKGIYIQSLLASYERYLLEQKKTDFAGLIDYLQVRTNETIYVAMEPTGWSHVENRMMEKIAGDRLLILEPDHAFHVNTNFSGNSFEMFRVAGTMAEVREGFRRILADPISLDRTEIILSDYERYASVLHSIEETLGVTCTFSAGLPIVFTGAGRVASGMLAWIEEGYPLSKLVEMLRHGEITFKSWDASRTQSEWIRLFENSGIGWGKERYITMLQPERFDVEKQEQVALMLEYVQGWFADLPSTPEDWSPVRLLEWVSSFVSQYASTHTQEDIAVQASLKELSTQHVDTPYDTMPVEMAITYVREMLNSTRIRVQATPKPGAVHISSIQNGGLSGRERTWLVGMDERSWTLSVTQDPVLLDQERTQLSPYLRTMEVQAKHRRVERESRLSMIRGQMWLSYTSYDIGEQKTQSPAFEMLQIVRIQTGDRATDFGFLERALGEPYGVMDIMHPKGTSNAMDNTDVWTQLLIDNRGNRKDGGLVLHQVYPLLAEGSRARSLREAEALSPYDGWLDSGSDEQGSTFVSVSQLEHYASCGLQYYFHYVLKLRSKDITEYDRTRWLLPNEKGTLLHDIFRAYLEESTVGGLKPVVHNRIRLVDITEAVIHKTTAAIPAPSPHVWTKECEEIRRDVEIFYRKELANSDQPCFFELELTLGDGIPMEVELHGGMKLKLKGFVDRVDRIAPHQYRIIDYKTGSPGKYKDSEYFSGGTQLQHALYSVAVEQWLHQTGTDTEAQVIEAEYYFPTERGRGDNVRRSQNRREELASVISQLLDSRERGLYIPTKDVKQCRWCDYQASCGQHPVWMEEKRNAPENADLLRVLLEVELID